MHTYAAFMIKCYCAIDLWLYSFPYFTVTTPTIPLQVSSFDVFYAPNDAQGRGFHVSKLHTTKPLYNSTIGSATTCCYGQVVIVTSAFRSETSETPLNMYVCYCIERLMLYKVNFLVPRVFSLETLRFNFIYFKATLKLPTGGSPY